MSNQSRPHHPPASTFRSPTRRRRDAAFAAAFEGLEQRRLLTAVVGITVPDPSAGELNLATGNFRLTRDSVAGGALTVDLAITGTATNGTDYNTIAATATFGATATTADIVVTPKQDTEFEGSETVIIGVTDGTGYTADSGHASATVTIVDDDKPLVSIAATDNAALEGDEDSLATGTFTLTRTGNTDGPLAVKVVVGGTATNGTDYASIATTLTIPADEETLVVTLTPTDDATLEGTETATLTLATDPAYTMATGAGATATISIADDEVPTLTLAVADATAAEGSATDTGKFTITRNGPTTAALEVAFVLSGTSTGGTDYDAITGTITIPATKSSVDVIVKTKQDTTVEGSETAILTLSTAARYLLDSAHKTGTVTIADDDKPVVSVVATDTTAVESVATGSNTSAYFTVTRSVATNAPLTVPLVFTGTATNGTDYKGVPTTVVIPAGKTSARVKIKAKDDELLEGNETVILTLAPGTDFTIDAAAKTGTVTIGDDEVPEVAIVATDAVATEPASDKGLFTVSRTGPTTEALTVNYSVAGSATNGVDVDTIATSLVIPAGKASATISVSPKDDTTLEPTETVILALADSDSFDKDVDAYFATVKVVDNEKPTISIAATDASAAEASSGTGTFTITRDGPTNEALSVTLLLTGDATKVADYAAFDTTVTIAAGSATRTITVTPVDDSAVEGSQAVILTVAPTVAYTVGTDKTATVTIADNDLATVGIAATDGSATEGADKGTFTLTRDGPTTAAMTVHYVVSGTATGGTDYTALTGTAVIPIGKATFAVDVATIQDTSLEGSETVILTLDDDDAYAIDSGHHDAQVGIADDEKPVVTLAATDATAEEGDTDETGTFTFTRTGPTTDALQVDYVVTGTAITGTDTTTALTGRTTIAAGSLTKVITLTGRQDSEFEGSETVILTLKPGATLYTLGEAKTGTVTVTDDDKPTVSIVATKATAKENPRDTLVYTVTRTGSTAAPLTVAIAATGTAVAADVLETLPTAVTIPAGKLFSTITISTKDDTTYEGSETVVLTVDDSAEDAPFTAAAGFATGTIADNELPTISITASDPTASETAAATGTFTVARAAATADAVTVTLLITGSAKNGKDYATIAKTVTIAAGSASRTITVTPRSDTAVEGPETVTIAIAPSAAAYNITADTALKSGTVTIDDAQTPTVSVVANDASINEGDGVGTWFRISRNGRTLSTALDVQLAISGSADDAAYTIRDEDGHDITDHVTLAAGEAYIDVYVRPIDNTAAGSDATVILTLSEDDAYQVDNTADAATVTIADDD